MNKLLAFASPFLKAVLGVVVFILGLGWGAYAAVSAIAKAESEEAIKTISLIREADMGHLNKRFDKIESLIKETNKD